MTSPETTMGTAGGQEILADAIFRIKGGNTPTEGKFNESDRI